MVNNLDRIVANVERALALDWYQDESGKTEYGALVYSLKYFGYNQGKFDTLIKLLARDIKIFLKDIDLNLIIPIPSYNPKTDFNPYGDYKMMYDVVKGLSIELSKPYSFDLLQKLTSSQAKNSQLKKADYQALYFPFENSTVLILDDLFQTGSSANFSISSLKELNPGIKIFFISLTQNKNGGLPRLTTVKARINFNYGVRLSQKTGSHYISMQSIFDENIYFNIFEHQDGYNYILDTFQNNKSNQLFNITLSKYPDSKFYNVKTYHGKISE